MASARPRSRSQPKSATVALLPGITMTSISARSAGSLTQRTTTPGSQASASISVEFEIRGSRTAPIRNSCRPCGATGTPTSAPVTADNESSASSHSSSL